MKYLKYVTILVFLGGFAFIMGCSDDTPEGLTPEEEQLEKLTATWSADTQANSVTLDGDDRTADWTGFQLTATATKSYSTVNSADDNVWPSSGTWDFQGTEGSGLNTLVRSDGVPVTIVNLSETSLELSFTYVLAQPNKEGRIESIEGTWVFKMTKN